MDFTPNPDHEAIRAGIRPILADFPDEYWRERDASGEFPWEFYRAVAEGGWLGIALSEEYGGGGLGVTEAGILVQEDAASGGALAACSTIHANIFGLLPLERYGTEEQKRRYLPAAATGDLITAFSVTEPTAGTDTSRISTFARKVDGGYLVSGQKVWTSRAMEAERLVLLVRTAPREEGKRRTDGMSLFISKAEGDGLEKRPIEKMGREAVDSCEIFFDDFFVEDADLIGEEGNGFRQLLDGLNPERVLTAMEAIGVGRAALRKAVAYANERVVFDRLIGQNQGIQFPLAEALARLEAAEMMAMKAAWLYDNGLPCGTEANIAKYLGAEAGSFAADRAVQTHGGFGYAKEYDVERYYREIRIFQLGPLTQEMVLNYLGHNVLGLPKSY